MRRVMVACHVGSRKGYFTIILNLEITDTHNITKERAAIIMDCQFPHKEVTFQAKKHKSFKKLVASFLPAPYCLPCPQLSLNQQDQLVLLKAETVSCPLLKLSKTNHSYPVPIFVPFVAHCGQGPIPENLLKSNLHSRRVLKDNLRYEIKLLMRKKKNLSLDEIIAAWEQKGEKHFPTLSCFARKYGGEFDYDQEECKYGGNLCSVRMDNKETFLIHSTLGENGDVRPHSSVSLCLSRVTENDAMRDSLMDVGHKVSVKNGRIYQITTSCNSLYKNNTQDIIFGTRQMHSSRLWKVQANEESRRGPVIKLLHEKTDESSTVKSIDVNPFFHTEYCELRSGKFTAYRDGLLHHEKDVDKSYRYCLYQRDRPLQLLLASKTSVSLLDTRSHSLQPLLSMSSNILQTYWNLPSGEHIHSFTPSSRPHISYMTTETSVLVWDHRFGSRALSRMAHFLEHCPRLLTSVKLSTDEEWIFLESEKPYSSGMLALRWSEEPLISRSSTNTLSTPSVLMVPIIRKTLGDTICQLQKTIGWGVDWSLQNRFKQHVTGLTSHFDEDDGTIQIWNSTAAGDIFVQQLNRTKNLEESQITSDGFLNKMIKWSEKLAEYTVKPEPKIEALEIVQCPYIRNEMGKAVCKSPKRNYNFNSRNSFFSDPENLPPLNLIPEIKFDDKLLGDPSRRSSTYLREWQIDPPLEILPALKAEVPSAQVRPLTQSPNEEPLTPDPPGIIPDYLIMGGNDTFDKESVEKSSNRVPQSTFPDFLMGEEFSFDEDFANHFSSTPAESAIPPIPNYSTPSTSTAKQRFPRNPRLLASSTPYARLLPHKPVWL